MKIGLVLDDSLDKTDGVQQYVLMMGRCLTSQGHEVHYLVGETGRTDLPYIHSLSRNVKVKFNQNRMAMPVPANMAKIRTLLAREQFDVLHVQVPYSPFLAGRIIKAAGPRTAVVGTFHVLPYSRTVSLANRLLGRAVRGSLKRFDTIISNTQATAAFATKTHGAKGPVVPLPVDLQKFAGAKPFDRYKNGRTVLFLGRLVERKGCQYLLRAVRHAIKTGTWPHDARVVICGRGHLETELKRYVASRGFADIVEFAGYITEEDKPRYLASADIVVYPSTGGESFGIVLLEAMAAGNGVVLAGDNPGYASVMAPHPDSLFDPRDTSALADKIVQTLSDAKLARAAVVWQRQYVKQFDIATVGKRTVEIYEQALHKRRS